MSAIPRSISSGTPAWLARTNCSTGRASSAMTTPSRHTLAIMYTRPPKLVGICAAFSVSNCGKRVPKQSASALVASV